MRNTMRKILAAGSGMLMLSTALAAIPAQSVSAADPVKIVILGDSISSGYALKSGEYGYYDYLADCLGGTVTNYAVPGYTTQNLLDLLDDKSKQPAISAANYISISIGANDLVKPAQAYVAKAQKEGESIMDTLKRVAKEGNATDIIADLTRELREPRKTAKANFTEIESKLRTLNPNAEIVFQTLYNPFEVSDSVLAAYTAENRENYASIKSYINNTEGDLNKALQALTNSKTADVFSAFINSGWIYVRTNESDIHPTALGHALIAATILDTLGCTGKSEKFAKTYHALSAEVANQIPADDNKQIQKYTSAVKGDYDGDCEVTAIDAQNVLVAYTYGLATGSVKITDAQKTACDIDGDGKITSADAQLILLYFTENTVTGNPTTWEQLLNK